MHILTRIVFMACLLGFMGLPTAHGEILIQDDFRSRTLNDPQIDLSGKSWGSPGGGTETIETIPGTQMTAIRYRYIKDQHGFIRTGFLPGSSRTSLYVQWLTYFAPGFEFPQDGNMWRINAAPESKMLSTFTRNGSNGFRVVADFYEPVFTKQVFHFDVPGGLKSGHLYFVQWEYILNTPGQSNGQMRVWVDGQKLFDRSDLSLRGTYTGGIDRIGLLAQWKNAGKEPTNPPNDEYRTNIVILDTRSDVVDASSEPPRPPSGLRVTGQ